MGTDVELTYPHALARDTDPHTSHLAAADIERSGKAAHQRNIVLQALNRFAKDVPRTAAELAKIAWLDRYMVSRRLSELVKANEAVKRPSVMCPVRGKRSVAWQAKTLNGNQGRLF